MLITPSRFCVVDGLGVARAPPTDAMCRCGWQSRRWNLLECVGDVQNDL